MKNILIVEPGSTGKNFVQDIIDRNYNPLLMILKESSDSEQAKNYKKMVETSLDGIAPDCDLIYEQDSYEETLQLVKSYNPLLIIPGTEKGVRLATRMSEDLNLLGNSMENIDAMTRKDEMHKRLAENNLRHIKGKVVHSLEEAIDYYDSEGFEEVVIKPISGSGSVSVKICLNKQEMIEAVKESFKHVDFFGNVMDEFLLQERIKGEEYIVNTVSHKGIHRVTTIWKYTKITTEDGDQIYDNSSTVNELGLGESELVEYAYDVADAIGIQYGAVHGEYMVDEKGPVLIEVNCRVMGASMDAIYLDKISGQHETDSVLDSYLNPKKFFFEQNKGYHLYEHGVIKLFIVPKDLVAQSSPMHHISNKLKSHYKTSLATINDLKSFPKTKDLETTGGTVFLTHEDKYQVLKDLKFLQSIEKNAFQLVLSEGLEKKVDINEEESDENIKYLINNIKGRGTTILITDKIFDDLDILQVLPGNLDKIKGVFDCVVLNINKNVQNTSDNEIVKFVLALYDKIKVGGLIFIPKTTYDAMPNGKIGAEALIKTLDLKIELPLYNYPKVLIASKR